jgi:hypothetical protein
MSCEIRRERSARKYHKKGERRHTLPTSGNWVRLSARQQHEVTSRAASARRHRLEAQHSGREPFEPPLTLGGSEPRLSASRRWAHQTGSDLPFVRGGGAAVHGPQTGAAALVDETIPGSFLPLRAFASRLH